MAENADNQTSEGASLFVDSSDGSVAVAPTETDAFGVPQETGEVYAREPESGQYLDITDELAGHEPGEFGGNESPEVTDEAEFALDAEGDYIASDPETGAELGWGIDGETGEEFQFEAEHDPLDDIRADRAEAEEEILGAVAGYFGDVGDEYPEGGAEGLREALGIEPETTWREEYIGPAQEAAVAELGQEYPELATEAVTSRLAPLLEAASQQYGRAVAYHPDNILAAAEMIDAEMDGELGRIAQEEQVKAGIVQAGPNPNTFTGGTFG